MKVYFFGASGTGKTTLAKFVCERFRLPLICGVVMGTLAEKGLTWEQVYGDPVAADAFQQVVWERQLEREAQFWESEDSGFVSDRGFDALAYTADHARIVWQLVRGEPFKLYIDRLQTATRTGRAVVFFVRPVEAVLAAARASDNGRRSPFLEASCVHRIDGMIQFLLESNEIGYIPIAGGVVRDRLRLVESVLTLAGRK